MTATLRKYVAFGTGVGIRISRDQLTVTVSRVRPTGVRVLGELDINGFRNQPAAEWGAACNAFLRKLGAAHLAASVLLPREEVVVRQLALPGVADADLAGAIRFQIDSLHPWPEEEAVYDYARIGKTGAVLIAITRRAVIDHWATLFAEAGIKVASFTVSAASIWSALRFFAVPGDGFLAFAENGSTELYGESAARPVFSTSDDGGGERVIRFALSELRLPPASEPVALAELLPKPAAAPTGADLSHSAVPYAASMSAACPHLSMRLNLLPEEQRQASSRARLVPTWILAGAVALMALALLVWGRIENRRYLQSLETEIRSLTPVANHAAELERRIVQTRNRTALLDAFRGRTREDMDALNDLTRLLAPPAWLHNLEMNRKEVVIRGETDQASGLVKVLDNSPHFQGSQFVMPIARGAGGENFAIRTQRKGVAP